MVLDNDGVAFKTTKEKVKSLDLKAKVTRKQTTDDSDSQGGSDEDLDKEEEAKAFNLMASNLCKFFRKGNRFGRDNRFGNSTNRFGRGRRYSFGNKLGESPKQKGVTVEHDSGLAFDLIRIGQLCDDDWIVSFTKVDCTISK
nr:hypothetical protein [Tanacetum cinerariifolium]